MGYIFNSEILNEENETPECPRCHKEPKYNNIIVKHLKDLEGED